MDYEKYTKDGKVAVLYSPGWGAGWSTWESTYGEALIFDRELVEAVLAGNKEGVRSIVARKYPEVHTGGLHQLEVEWVPVGDRFEITEYDGNESVRVFEPDDGYVA